MTGQDSPDRDRLAEALERLAAQAEHQEARRFFDSEMERLRLRAAENASRVGQIALPPAETATPPTKRERRRTGKAYPGATVAGIILRVRLEQPSRALRDRLYADEALRTLPGATTTLIERVLKQMGGKKLSVARRKRWDRAATRLIDDGSVTLAELEKRLR